MPIGEARTASQAEWSAYVLRCLINYHERSHLQITCNMDGTNFCDKEWDCPCANHDPFLNGLKYALAAVEKEA